MDLLWIYDGAFVRDSTELGRLYKIIKDNLQNVRIKNWMANRHTVDTAWLESMELSLLKPRLSKERQSIED